MAVKHRYDEEIVDLATTSQVNSRYRSDHRQTVFGGRGGKSDEIAFLKAQSLEDAPKKLSDAWISYTVGLSILGSNRYDQLKRRFHEESGF